MNAEQTRSEWFAAWLSMNDFVIEDQFFVDDVPNMPDNPYSEGGLRVAEAAALASFTDTQQVLAPDNRELFDRYLRYLGETFVRALGFIWTNTPKAFDDGKPFVAVGNDQIDVQIEIPPLLTSAVARRTGDEWAFIFRNTAEDLGISA